MTEESPLTSRKFWISMLATIVSCGIPVIYKHLEISDTITISVLGIVSALALGYGGLNLIDKKLSNDSK